MNELNLNTFLTNDYIYIPYDNKEAFNLRENKIVYKNDTICTYNNKTEFSPISGLAYGLSEINSLTGKRNVLIIENDFKDKTFKKPISKKDIYSLDTEYIKEITSHLITKKTLTLEISFKNAYDLKDEYILKDYIKEVLETLNLIDQTYDNLKTKIKLGKKDIISYQILFSYLGTYPNIEIDLKNEKSDETTINLYEIIDIYNKLKNTNIRDFIYLSVTNNGKTEVIKTKRNSNLKDLLVHLNLMSTNIIINGKYKIENGNFLLDENITTININ